MSGAAWAVLEPQKRAEYAEGEAGGRHAVRILRNETDAPVDGMHEGVEVFRVNDREGKRSDAEQQPPEPAVFRSLQPLRTAMEKPSDGKVEEIEPEDLRFGQQERERKRQPHGDRRGQF